MDTPANRSLSPGDYVRRSELKSPEEFVRDELAREGSRKVDAALLEFARTATPEEWAAFCGESVNGEEA